MGCCDFVASRGTALGGIERALYGIHGHRVALYLAYLGRILGPLNIP